MAGHPPSRRHDRRVEAVGVPRRTAARLVRLGVLHRPTAGVFVLAGTPSTLHQRAAVLCATHPGGFITGPTAGVLAGLRHMPRRSLLHLSLRHGINPDKAAGVLVRQTTKIQPADRLRRSDGITVASWPRLAFDLAADLNSHDHRTVVEQLLERQLVSRDELRAVGERLCQPARRGSTRFAHTMACLGDRAPVDSDAELRLLDLLRARDVPVDTQVPVMVEFGLIHLDLGVRAVRWGVELDIHPEHRTMTGQARDADRRRAANGVGWQVEPVTELDMRAPEGLADRLAANYRDRCRRLLPA